MITDEEINQIRKESAGKTVEKETDEDIDDIDAMTPENG